MENSYSFNDNMLLTWLPSLSEDRCVCEDRCESGGSRKSSVSSRIRSLVICWSKASLLRADTFNCVST